MSAELVEQIVASDEDGKVESFRLKYMRRTFQQRIPQLDTPFISSSTLTLLALLLSIVPVLGCPRQRRPAIACVFELHVGAFSSSSFTAALCPDSAANDGGVRPYSASLDSTSPPPS